MAKTGRDWSLVPWTKFEIARRDDSELGQIDPPDVILINSRYQVAVYVRGNCEPFGKIAHLSIKVHDRSAYHDWRDLQRLKNEICGRECEAVEVYPAESKLVDTSNQYHLFVFQDYRIPFGFQQRLVADGQWQKSVQRPWPDGERPADCLDAEAFQGVADRVLAERGNVKK